MKIKWVIAAGARPNFMKIAPLIRELRKHPEIERILVHTGQHYDKNLSDIFFHDLGITPPDIRLTAARSSPLAQMARLMIDFERVLRKQRPDLVIVAGDVNSTLACAITAAKSGIRLAHLEAGMRSFDKSMPEEINRISTDHLSDLLFTSCRQAGQNLLKEGISPERIHCVGDLMADNLLHEVRKIKKTGGNATADYAVLTLHRQANVDCPGNFLGLCDTFNRIARKIPILFPMHPRTRKQARRLKVRFHPAIRLLDPLGYRDFLKLLIPAKFVLTDSGGLQTETSILGIPCITLRDNTEHTVTLGRGTNVLTGRCEKRILCETRRVLRAQRGKKPLPEEWDGKAARRTVKILLNQRRNFSNE